MSVSRNFFFVLLLFLFCYEIVAKEDKSKEENEKTYSETQKVKKIVLELDLLPTPVFQDVTEPRQQLHRATLIEVYQPVDFEGEGVRWLNFADLQFLLVDPYWYSDGSSKEERLSKYLRSSPEEQGDEYNFSESNRENMWKKIVLSSVSGHSFECAIPPLQQTVDRSDTSLGSLNWSYIMSQFNGTCFYRVS